MNETPALDITFRCPPELERLLPRPIPAVQGLPDWFKSLPQQAFSALTQEDMLTVKKCPPFIDAMTCGFLMPLAADVRVEDGVLSWDQEFPGGAISNYPRSPISFHDSSQVRGTPLFDDDQFVVKFNNFWTVELPPGCTLLCIHPVNRADLPFHSVAGLVDADQYRDNFINFPARWIDRGFKGVLPRGTPVVQCIPFRRDAWQARFETIAPEDAARFHETRKAVNDTRDVYRREFRAPKR